MPLRPSGNSLSTELWILLTSWHVTLRRFVASTMRTCLLTTCALALAPVCSRVLLACVGLPPSLQLTSAISVSPSLRLWFTLRLRLGGRGGEAVLVATPDSAHSGGSSFQA